MENSVYSDHTPMMQHYDLRNPMALIYIGK